jgi:hypothetical protein
MDQLDERRNNMEFISENWAFIVLTIAAIAVGVVFAIRFFKSSKEEQMKKIREWLVYATTIAEKELGGGTGQLKLRQVYDMFVSKFTWLAKIISFDKFSELVDEALGDMNKLLQTNTAVSAFVNGSVESEI